MQLRRYHVKFSAPVLSPLHAETVFGHVCWALRDMRGESVLAEFLGRMLRAPALLLSDLLPHDCLPRPLIQPPAFRPEKEFRRARYLQYGHVLPSYDPEKLSRNKALVGLPELKTVETTGVAMDRVTGMALEGALFTRRGVVCEAGFDLLAAGDTGELLDMVHASLCYMRDHGGYGADKSCGRGQIESVEETPVPEELRVAFAVEGPAPRLLLSGCVPSGVDLLRSTYRTRVKYGRLAEAFVQPNPFKKPVVYLDSGSVVTGAGGASSMGRMVEDVSPAHPEVVQYGYGMSVAVKNAWEVTP